jgi:hypothetical protein
MVLAIGAKRKTIVKKAIRQQSDLPVRCFASYHSGLKTGRIPMDRLIRQDTGCQRLGALYNL